VLRFLCPSAVLKWMSCEIIRKKGALSMHIILTASVNFTCLSGIPGGKLDLFITTCSCVAHVFFPLKDPRLGTNVSSVLKCLLS